MTQCQCADAAELEVNGKRKCGAGRRQGMRPTAAMDWTAKVVAVQLAVGRKLDSVSRLRAVGEHWRWQMQSWHDLDIKDLKNQPGTQPTRQRDTETTWTTWAERAG